MCRSYLVLKSQWGNAMPKIMLLEEKTFWRVRLIEKLMKVRCVKQLTMVVCIRSSTNCWTLALKALVELSSTWWRKPEVALDSLALPESSPLLWCHLPRDSASTDRLLRPFDTPSRPGNRRQEATNSPTNTLTCFRHLLSLPCTYCGSTQFTASADCRSSVSCSF